MKILVLGKSNIFTRRIGPALRKIKAISSIEIASKSKSADWNDYQEALRESKADLVYVSLANHLHFEYAKKALELGKHVIVDKPITTKLSDAKKLVKIAKAKNRCLAEANVYAYHSQILKLKKLDEFKSISVHFTFPPLPNTNYRYQKESGLGAIDDLGPYALSPARIFFNALPNKIFTKVTKRKSTVPIAFSLMATYSGNRVLTAHCSFDAAYMNSLTLIGEKTTAWLDRAFTTPANMKNSIYTDKKIAVPAADSFENFIRTVLEKIKKQDYQIFLDDLLRDAKALQRLRESI